MGMDDKINLALSHMPAFRDDPKGEDPGLRAFLTAVGLAACTDAGNNTTPTSTPTSTRPCRAPTRRRGRRVRDEGP